MFERHCNLHRQFNDTIIPWYLCLVNCGGISTCTPVKQFTLYSFCLQYASTEQEEEGRKRYETQKTERLDTKARIEEVVPPPPNPGNILRLRDDGNTSWNYFLTVKVSSWCLQITGSRHSTQKHLCRPESVSSLDVFECNNRTSGYSTPCALSLYVFPSAFDNCEISLISIVVLVWTFIWTSSWQWN